MISLLAVVLSMENVVSSEDLVEQVSPKHLESPKNLVSKDITVLPRLPKNGVLSPGQQNAVTPGGSVHELDTGAHPIGGFEVIRQPRLDDLGNRRKVSEINGLR